MPVTKTKASSAIDTLVSARVKLTDEERKTIKDAYYEMRSADLVASPKSIGGSAIKVVSATQQGELERKLGLSHLVFTDLVNSKESMSVPILLNIQSVLGISILTKKRIMDAAKSYVDFVWATYESK